MPHILLAHQGWVRAFGLDTGKYHKLVNACEFRIVTVKQRPRGQRVAEAECFADLIAMVHMMSVSALWGSVSQVLELVWLLVQFIPSPGVIYIGVVCLKPFLEEYTGKHLMPWSGAGTFSISFVFSHQPYYGLLMPLHECKDAAQK